MVATAVLAGAAFVLGFASQRHASLPAVNPAAALSSRLILDGGQGGGAPPDAGSGRALTDGGLLPAPVPLGSASIVGVVVDEGGRAVAGARVRAVGEDLAGAAVTVPAAPLGDAAGRVEVAGELGVLRGPIPFPPSAPVLSATFARSSIASDGRGRFTIAGLPAGRFAVLATDPRFVDGRSAELSLVDGGRGEARITLTRGLSVRGRVVDERGTPIAGAELWSGGELATTSDGRGAFTIERLAGKTVLEARALGRLAATRTIDPALDHDLEISLAPAAGRLAGVVVDERGFPVGGARITAVAGGFEKEAISGARGDFSLAGAPAGKLAVTVRHAEHPPASAEGVAGEELRISLLPGGGVAGEVRDSRTGTCPAGVRITVESGELIRSATVDARGRFRALGCSPGAATLHASAPGYLPASLPIEIPTAEAAREITLRDQRIELTLGGSIAVHVQDDRGAPARGIEVEAGGITARTDAAGRCRLAPIAAGRVKVAAPGDEQEVLIDPGREARVELQVR